MQFGIGGSLRTLAFALARGSLVALSAVLACLLGVVGVLLFWSYPGRPKALLDENGTPLANSLSEKVFIDVNGVREGMIIESKDASNPVLLYLHGGMPEYFLNKRYPSGLENLFTVVWWEQRGTGLSYNPGIARASLTTEQYIADTLAVTDYLRRRFGQEKIYLMGHSGGTFFGIQAAARAPHKFHAYIGVAQMVNQLESERLAYEYMLLRFREDGNTGMVRRLEAAPVSGSGGITPGYLAVRDEGMHRLGIGTLHEMTDVMRGLFLASLQAREYTLSEKINLWRGKLSAGVSTLWDEAITTDLAVRLPEVSVPVFFLHGVYDYTVSYQLAKTYYERLRAPLKGFYTFEYSAHSPMFEEPGRVQEILRTDILVERE